MLQKGKQTSIREILIRNLSSVRDQEKSMETREVAYTCRYTSGHLIPNQLFV